MTDDGDLTKAQQDLVPLPVQPDDLHRHLLPSWTTSVTCRTGRRLSVRFNDAQSACYNGDWGFRVVVATNAPPFPPPTWRRDGLPVGVITAFRLPKGPPAVSFP